MCAENMNDGAESPDPPASAWPESLAGLGAVRFARHYYHFKEAVHFYRDLVGLPVYETFEGSYGSNGVIFGMPGASLTFELVETDEPVTVDRHEQICLYFFDAGAKERATARLRQAGMEPVQLASLLGSHRRSDIPRSGWQGTRVRAICLRQQRTRRQFRRGEA